MDGKTTEITAFAPLLGIVTSTDLTGVVVTVDVLHTEREHVEEMHRRGVHWVLSAKATSPVGKGRRRHGWSARRRDRQFAARSVPGSGAHLLRVTTTRSLRVLPPARTVWGEEAGP